MERERESGWKESRFCLNNNYILIGIFHWTFGFWIKLKHTILQLNRFVIERQLIIMKFYLRRFYMNSYELQKRLFHLYHLYGYSPILCAGILHYANISILLMIFIDDRKLQSLRFYNLMRDFAKKNQQRKNC